MAELADAYGSGPYVSNYMQVQVLLSAPNTTPERAQYAGVAELADAQDLGSCGNTVQVQVLSPAPKNTERSKALFCVFYDTGLEPEKVLR